MKLYCRYYKSPIGTIKITATKDELVSVDFEEEKNDTTEENEILKETIKQLDEYFNGKRMEFKLRYKIEGTDFQKKVWSQLEKIPYGKTVSYEYIAKNIGNEKACRAVGNANNKNKIAIIIPCHRVIGKNNKLTGYAGGLDKKSWLIEHENKLHV